jgi:hypothetical protein
MGRRGGVCLFGEPESGRSSCRGGEGQLGGYVGRWGGEGACEEQVVGGGVGVWEWLEVGYQHCGVCEGRRG